MVSIGGHWGVLQVVAWAKMLQNYSAEKGLVAGFMETFDGEHPCPMCMQLKEAQSQEKKDTPSPLEKSVSSAKWLSALECASVFTLPQPEMTGAICAHPYHGPATQWQSQPAVPPPRPVSAAC